MTDAGRPKTTLELMAEMLWHVQPSLKTCAEECHGRCCDLAGGMVSGLRLTDADLPQFPGVPMTRDVRRDGETAPWKYEFKDTDGKCVNLDPVNFTCRCHVKRPLGCRAHPIVPHPDCAVLPSYDLPDDPQPRKETPA
jgi:Fe-S-cluster containining protein